MAAGLGKHAGGPHRERRWLGGLCLLACAAYLAVGWWPFTPFPENGVRWSEPGPGLQFTPPALAFTPEPVSLAQGDGPAELTLVLRVEPAARITTSGLRYLLVSYAGTREQLVLCQWGEHLILRLPRADRPGATREVSIPVFRARTRITLAITSSSAGTTFHVDGRRVRHFPSFAIPASAVRGRWVVGNAPDGRRSWAGTLEELTAFDRVLSPAQLAAAAAPRQGQQAWWKPLGARPVVAFGLEEGRGRAALDTVQGVALQFPVRYERLSTSLLELPAGWKSVKYAGMLDLWINVLGFAPFGWWMAQYLGRQGTPGFAWVGAVLLSGALSLIIEVGQAWLPSRFSTVLDLIWNLLGGLLGATVAVAGQIVRGRSRGT